ncbi:MAG TPA: preprotein translocase subunit SecG [Pirellulales bacterium]|jgi:preprotein translocase subunit SecG|nr:preprotein translocase subunit SecG [Pirellulales bacterium]
MSYLLGIFLALSSFILIVLVLIQQGRGGGLAGAFGGMGGQSAFGTKAGDLFTKITIFVAAFWILMCVATVKWATVRTESSPFGASLGTQAGPAVVPGDDGAKDGDAGAKDTDKTPAKTPPKSPPAEDKAGGDDSQSPAEKK